MPKKERKDLKASADRIFLAGLGALTIAEEEGTKLFKKLVRKGENYDGPAREQYDRVRSRLEEVREQVDGKVKDVREKADERAQGARGKADDARRRVESGLQDAVNAAIERIGMPSKREIQELTHSVERLMRQIEVLKAERGSKTGGGTGGASQSRPLSPGEVAGMAPANGPAAPRVAVAEAVGGGWYEIRVDGVTIEKVKGRADADAAVGRLNAPA
jgi:poly(hydroxyalkanoate) granule-associated protein